MLDDHLVSLQMMTSKADVYIKLQILDHEEEIISAVGKGHVVLPAFVFQKDNAVPSEEENKRSSSRQCKSFNKMCLSRGIYMNIITNSFLLIISAKRGGGNNSHQSISKKRSGSANQEGRFSVSRSCLS